MKKYDRIFRENDGGDFGTHVQQQWQQSNSLTECVRVWHVDHDSQYHDNRYGLVSVHPR